MAIEIIGVLVGLLAAIALGEVLKSVSNRRTTSILYFSIEDELLDVHEELAKGTSDPIPIPVWSACINDGRLLDLSYGTRRELTTIYREIEFYNTRRTNREKVKAVIEDFFDEYVEVPSPEE